MYPNMYCKGLTIPNVLIYIVCSIENHISQIDVGHVYFIYRVPPHMYIPLQLCRLCAGYAAVDSSCEWSCEELSANHQRFITTSCAHMSRHPHTHTCVRTHTQILTDVGSCCIFDETCSHPARRFVFVA